MGERLLLVESDSTLCGQLARFLKTLGYKVDAVDSVGAALAALRSAPPALTLLDAQLDEDPATIAFATRQCDAGLIIMGRPEIADALVIDIGVEVSPDQVLHKPFSAQDLSNIVQGAIKARADKAEAEERRLLARNELDDQLGALQAALGELTGAQDPAGLAEPDPLADEPPAPAEAPASAPHGLLVGSEPDAAEFTTPTPPTGAPARAADRASAEPPDAPERPKAPGVVSTTDSLLDASALPDVPLASIELIAQFAMRPMTAESPLDPRGIYGPVTMPELLYNCFRDLFSGWLMLRRGAVTKTVLLRGGRPVFAHSNVKAETLGTMLVSAGRLSPEDSERSLRYADALGIRQGEAIVRLGMLSESELRDGLRDQLTARLVNCFSWSSAEYGLTYDPEASEGTEASEVNPLVVIFEGVKTRYPLAPLMAHYDQLIRQAPRSTPRLADYATMLRAYREELVLVESCDGTRSLGEVLAISPLGLIGTLRVMRALESMNCLTYGSVSKSAGPAPVRARTTGARAVRPSGRGSDGLRTVRRAGKDAAARSEKTTDTGRVSGSYRTLRGDERTITGSHRTLRPAGAHSSGIRRAGTRRTDQATEGASPRTGGPASRGPASRGPASRGPASRGASRGPVPRRTVNTTGQRVTGGPSAGSTPAEAPSALVARLEAAADSYALLGVSHTANRATISKASAQLMRTLTQLTTHGDPDVERSARALFAVVKKAGEALTNPQRRRAYDALNLPIPAATGTDLVAAESDFKLGRICMASAAMDRARSYFERAAVQDPHQAIYQVYLAWATFGLASDVDRRARMQAVELAREALKTDGSRDDGYVLLGRMYQALNSHDQAVRAFSKALEINSGNTEARTGLKQLETDQAESKKDAGLFGNLFGRR